jgi:hypothetical protein
MAAWVLWDDAKGGFAGMARQLPNTLQGRDASALALLGYHELVVRHPEDFIARFPNLLGRSVFEMQPDGRVLQTFPESDFSVAKVREELVAAVKLGAGRELAKTDWYIVRKAELGTSIPDDVTTLRQKIRDHVEWLSTEIAGLAPRELVDFEWRFPTEADQTMIDGMPLKIVTQPPLPVPDEPLRAAVIHTGEGYDPEAHGTLGNDDPSVVEEAPQPPDPPVRPVPPPTTDGPVPLFVEGEDPPPTHDANGIPLVTAYAPTVEDPGPRPDDT